jgi:hypothetical protein
MKSVVFIRYTRVYRVVATWLGVLTLMTLGLLLACDAEPHLFPADAHDLLAALPLVLVALAYVAYQAARRAPPMEWAKTILLAVAFLFWAANQLWPDRRVATLFNDIAVAAFVLDVLLVMVGWPRPAAGTSASTRAADGSLGAPGGEPLTGSMP